MNLAIFLWISLIFFWNCKNILKSLRILESICPPFATFLLILLSFFLSLLHILSVLAINTYIYSLMTYFVAFYIDIKFNLMKEFCYHKQSVAISCSFEIHTITTNSTQLIVTYCHIKYMWHLYVSLENDNVKSCSQSKPHINNILI